MISGSLDILTGNSEKTESCVQGYPSVVVVSADTNVYLNNSKLDPQGGWKGGGGKTLFTRDMEKGNEINEPVTQKV